MIQKMVTLLSVHTDVRYFAISSFSLTKYASLSAREAPISVVFLRLDGGTIWVNTSIQITETKIVRTEDKVYKMQVSMKYEGYKCLPIDLFNRREQIYPSRGPK